MTELERLRQERNRLATHIYSMHNDPREGITTCIRIMKWGQEPGHDSELIKTLNAHDNPE